MLISTLIVIVAQAQKLPNKQDVSLRAPINTKVDGKDLEWNNHFQAYNNSIDVFYTMSNDDNNLYLVVQAEDYGTIRKITQGGITLSIDKPGAANHISITYPVVAKPLLFSSLTRKRNGKIVSLGDADSIINHNNSILEKNCKWIQAIGIEGLDSLISVYNTDGVKAAGLFNHDNKYTCEISVSLKHLGLSTNNPSKFSYDIRLNGAKSLGPMTLLPRPDGEPSSEAAERFIATVNASNAQLAAPTDFRGEYTLAKKL
jgi:hypothetical protein